MAKNAITVMEEGNKALDEINNKLKKTIENVLAINDAALKVGKNFFNVKTPSDLNSSLKQNKTFVNQLNAELKERQRLEKALQTQIERNKQAESDLNKELIKQRLETQQRNRLIKESAILSSKLSTEYQKQSLTLTQLRRKYKDVALSQGESSKQAKNLLAQITALDARLKRVDANVGQFQRSVGNYGKAMQSASAAARNLMGAMGFVGGAYLFVNTIRDAFNRVREFDKAMQNISGIMRTTRSEIIDLEKEIVRVAGSSIKTSREVAELAENLVTLGKTKDEIKDLLEPVNNLAIGLETTSGEAAEFLVQTLNAFGAGSDEAAKYADTIATIRTSTTLDFQKMRDSFQYLTPISRILNKDLAYTGSVLGILADNGLKAEQAGRLLGTAQQKLAKEGKSLLDALQQINEAQARGVQETELLALASKLFGAQAAKVGVIMANNTDKIEKNAQAIRDNSGALDDLVNEQLESLDAKIKILDSTWEKFILNVDNGNGVLSKAFGNIIEFITGAIEGMTKLNQSQQEYNDSRESELTAKYLKEQRELYGALGDSAERVALQRADASRDEIDNINAEIKALEERNTAIQKGLRGEGEKVGNATDFSRNETEINRLVEKRALYNAVLQASEEIIGIETEKVDENTEALGENTKEEEKNKEAKKKGIQAIKGSIAFFENEIKLLEEKQKKLATNSREYGVYEEKINKTKDALAQLKVEMEGIGNLQSIGDLESSFERISKILTEPKVIEGLEVDGANAEIEAFIDREERKREEAQKTVEYRKELESQLVGSLIDFTNTIFDAKVQRYDDEIQANNDKYAQLLDNEKLTEEQRSQLEAERERKNAELEKKKREEQRKAAIFNKAVALADIAINTSVAITKTLGQTGFLGIPLTTVIAALGAIQAATVLATPIPQYKHGKEKGKGKDSVALLNDGGKDELKISEDGTMQRITGRNVLGFVKKSDTIIPDADKFLSNLSDEELYNNLHRHTIMANVAHQQQTIDAYLMAKSIDKQTDRLVKAMERNRPRVNVHNNINTSVSDDLKFMLRKQNTL